MNTITPGQGGRKALESTVNLVPFIDLLTCCIFFLLLFAGTKFVGFDHGEMSEGGAGTDAVPCQRVVLTLAPAGFTASLGEQTQMFASDDWAALASWLGRARSEQPEVSRVQVRAQDGVLYDRLIHAVDTAKGARFEVVGVGEAL